MLTNDEPRGKIPERSTVDQSLEASIARLRRQRTAPRPLGAQERIDLIAVLDVAAQAEISERSLMDDVEALRIESAALVGELRAERTRTETLRAAAQAIVPNVEDCLRYLSTDDYRRYRDVWDATRTTLTALQLAASVEETP